MEKSPKSTTARQKILDRLQKLEPGALVRYVDLVSLGIAPGTVAVNLSRLRQEGVLQQVTKGTYRLPLQSRFGPGFRAAGAAGTAANAQQEAAGLPHRGSGL
jgi:hypothetical protein